MNKNTLIIGVVVVIIAAAAYLVFAERGLAPSNPLGGGEGGPVACTADAMQCPDGSWVGRSGPNCEFECPGN